MSWPPRLTASSASSSRDVNLLDNVEHLQSFLETQADLNDFEWSSGVRDAIWDRAYKTFWGSYSHCFTSEPVPSGTLLSTHQANTDPQYGADIPGMPCGHIFKKGDCCYKCKDCALDDSCVLCSRCFHGSDHEGHNVSFYLAIQPGGCCDCGDAEAWKQDYGCAYHPRDVQPARSSERMIPPELRHSMLKTLECVIDFILDSLDESPEETVPAPKNEMELSAKFKGVEREPLAVVLWNDEKHSFDEVTKALMDLINCTHEEGLRLAEVVDSEGRAIIYTSPDIPRIFSIARYLAQIDLGVTARPARDTFREQISAILIDWLVDLTRCYIYGTDGMSIRQHVASRLFEPRRGSGSRQGAWNNPPGTVPNAGSSRLEWLFYFHTRLWKRPRFRLKDLYITILSLSHEHKVAMAVRFANIYNRLMDSYLLVDREAENSVKYFALQLFTVPTIAEYLVKNNAIIDRLHNLIIAFFTNQIVNKSIVANPNLDSNPAADAGAVSVDSFPFRSKRFMPMFSDLRYICSNDSVQHLIASNGEAYISNFLRMCRLFMGINPNRRAATTHVEYEQEAWISVFNVTLSLSRVVRVYAEAFSKATSKMLADVICLVAQDIIQTCTRYRKALDPNKYSDIVFKNVSYGEKDWRVIDFDVLSGWVSFHHSEHWLLAELFKHVDLLSEEKLAECGYVGGLKGMLQAKTFSQNALQIVIEFPLRVLAMVAQIRSGLWVRNGFAIRGQLLHYRDYMLRDLCYDSDIYLLQTSLIFLDPNLVLVTMLHRFQLLEFFSQSPTSDDGKTLTTPVYEGNQLMSMVEEFLYVLITILSETAWAKKMPMDEIVRREAIHGLALGPCSYSELCKRVAERIMDEASFDRALQIIARFKAPEGVTDIGQYELKDEMYDEVNPFFFHYTRNRREEAEGILKTRIGKSTGSKTPVVVPKAVNINSGPFTGLSQVFRTEVFGQIVGLGLYRIALEPLAGSGQQQQSNDAVLDQIVHLIMLGLVEQPEAFSKICAETAFLPLTPHPAILEMLCTMETLDSLQSVRGKVAWCIDTIALHQSAKVAQVRKVQPSEAQPKKDLEAKKRAAKARQAAIMKQFAAQQKSFLESVEDEDMSGDDDQLGGEDVHDPTKDLGTCIVCQEDLDSTRAFGALGLVQPSRLRRHMPSGSSHYLSEALKLPPSLDEAIPAPSPPEYVRPSESFSGFPPNSTMFGLHASFCGHLMHVECFNVYTFSVEQRHLQQTQRNHAENIERDEFICPLCKSLGNVILPVFDELTFDKSKTAGTNQTFSEWSRGIDIELLRAQQDRALDLRLNAETSGELGLWTAEDINYSATPKDDVHKMIQTLRTVAESVSQQSPHLHNPNAPIETNPSGGLYLPRHLVAHTIACLEITQRGIQRNGGSTLAENMTEPSMHGVRAMLVTLRKLAALSLADKPETGRTALRQAVFKRLIPQRTREHAQLPLLLRDPLTLLVEIAAVAPEFLSHATTLMFYATLARVSVGVLSLLGDAPSAATSTQSTPSSTPVSYERIFGDIRMFVMSVARHSPELERTASQILRTSSEQVQKLVYTFSLIFLRQAAIIARAVKATALPFPTVADSETSEYERLLEILQIPPPSTLPQNETLQALLGRWSSTYGMVHSLSVIDCSVVLDYPNVYRLVQLPRALDSLFTNANALLCHRCNTVPVDAAICMFCGTVCCHQMHCCMDKGQRNEGECNMHTRECAGVVGLYYCVKRCAMLYLYGGNGSVGPPPYLDVHGEIDLAMRRGRRQYLHPKRLEDLRKLWLNHGIPTFTARKLDSVIDAGGWDSI